MTRRFSLNTPATRADVIGWAFAIPVLTWAALFIPTAYQAAERFGEIFQALEAPVRPGAAFFLNIRGLGVAGLFGIVALLPVAALLACRRAWPKVLVPVACGIAMTVLNVEFSRSLLGPIQEVMEKTR